VFPRQPPSEGESMSRPLAGCFTGIRKALNRRSASTYSGPSAGLAGSAGTCRHYGALTSPSDTSWSLTGTANRYRPSDRRGAVCPYPRPAFAGGATGQALPSPSLSPSAVHPGLWPSPPSTQGLRRTIRPMSTSSPSRSNRKKKARKPGHSRYLSNAWRKRAWVIGNVLALILATIPVNWLGDARGAVEGLVRLLEIVAKA
jgi:hypothetical protein